MEPARWDRPRPGPVGRPPARRRSPHPSRCHAGSCPIRASPHPRCTLQNHPLPREEPGGEYLARTSRAAEGAQPAGALQPFLQPREPRVKCPARLQNGLPAPAGPRPSALLPLHLGPPPRLGFAFVPPLEVRFSRGGGEGEGGQRRVSFGGLPLPPPTVRPKAAESRAPRFSPFQRGRAAPGSGRRRWRRVGLA